MARFDRSHKVREVKICIRTGHEIHTAILDKIRLRTFGHTADYPYGKPLSIPCAATCIQFGQTRVNLLLGVVADGAGIQKHSISLRGVGYLLISDCLHNRCDNLTVGHIHLASVGLYVKFLGFHLLCSFSLPKKVAEALLCSKTTSRILG